MAHVESILLGGGGLRYPGKVLHSNIDLIFCEYVRDISWLCTLQRL